MTASNFLWRKAFQLTAAHATREHTPGAEGSDIGLNLTQNGPGAAALFTTRMLANAESWKVGRLLPELMVRVEMRRDSCETFRVSP